ncbi:MAG: alpha/beta hydrolase [Planctomycetaceae bacterium]
MNHPPVSRSYRLFDNFGQVLRTTLYIALLGTVGQFVIADEVPATKPAGRKGAARTVEPEADAAKPTRLVVYKEVGEVQLKLHLFMPSNWKKEERRGAVVFFFGGGWVGGSATQFYPHSAHLADLGMVAICAEYRVKSKHHTTPWECVADGHDAVRWVREHAGELGVDPDRIAAGGGSAGGHVAAAVALCDDPEMTADMKEVSSIPNALVLFNPVYDNGPEGWGHAAVKDRWESISPMHNIRRGMPPAIVFLGTNDALIPVATAEKFREKMRAVDVRSDLHLYEGATHGFFNQNKEGGKYYRETVGEMDKFLDSLGYFSPASKKESK